MFTTSKWKQNDKGPTCFLRNTEGDQKIISLTPYKVIIVDVPQSMGRDIEERIKYVKEILSTESVSHISDSYYKAITSVDVTIENINVFRDIYIIPPNVGVTVQLMDAEYHSNHVDGDFRKLNYIHTPRICFWDLEVEIPDTGTFPNSSVNPITMVSFGSNTSTNVELYTTLPEAYTTGVPCRVFETEKEMIEYTYMKIKENDVDCTYWGTGFDWPYLIERLRQNGSTIIDDSKDGVTTLSYCTNFNCNTYDTIDSYTHDHFDLMLFFKAAYPHFKDHKLDTVAEYIVNNKKVGVDINDLKKLKNLPEEPTPELYDLASKFLMYSIQDTQLLVNLWEKIYGHVANIIKVTGVSYSMVSTKEETIAFLYRYKPQLLLTNGNEDKSRIPKPYMDPGVYHNVFYYNFTDFMIHALMTSDDIDTIEMGKILSEYRYTWVVKDVFLNPMMKPSKLIPYENIVGISKNGFFINLPIELNGRKVEPISFHRKIIFLASASWITVEDGVYTYNGKHSACEHENNFIRYMVEKAIGIGRSLSPKEIKTIIPNFNDFNLEDFVITKKVTFFNREKYADALTDEQNRAFEADPNSWLKINYLHIHNGFKASIEHTREILAANQGAGNSDVLDTKYYIAQAVNVLKRLSVAYK